MNTTFFGELLQTISDRGRAFLNRERRGQEAVRSESLIELCEDLLSGRGEASGVALAREILSRYAELRTGPRVAFFEALAQRFGTDPEQVRNGIPDIPVAIGNETPLDELAHDSVDGEQPGHQPDTP